MGIINFMQNYSTLLNVVAIVILIVLFFLNRSFRNMVYNLMAKAEENQLSYEVLHTTVDKIHRSDLDDRMVLVIASVLNSFPILSLIPKPIIVSFLNNYVQSSFDRVKSLLHAKSKSTQKELEEKNQNLLPEYGMYTEQDVELNEKVQRGLTPSEALIAEAVSASILESLNKIFEEKKEDKFDKVSSKVQSALDIAEMTPYGEYIPDEISEGVEKVIRVKDIIDSPSLGDIKKVSEMIKPKVKRKE